MVDVCPVSEAIPVERPTDAAREKNHPAAVQAMTYAERRPGARTLCRRPLGDHALLCRLLSQRFASPWHDQDRTAFLTGTFAGLIPFWQAARMPDWLDRRYERGISAVPPRKKRRK